MTDFPRISLSLSITMILAWFSVMTVAQQADDLAAGSAATSRSLTDYQIIIDSNIFDRQRAGRPTEPVTPDEEEQPPPDESTEAPPPLPPPPRATPTTAYVLKGMMTENDQAIAFFENPITAQTMICRVKDTLEGGVITDITLDSVTYELDGEQTQLTVGQPITGQPHTTVATPSSAATPNASNDPAQPGSSAQADASKPPPANNPDNLSVVERMKRKRQQELNK